MSRECICISLTTQRMDFWLKVAALLHAEFDIVIVATSEYKSILEQRIPEQYDAFEVEEIYQTHDAPPNPDAVLAEALRIERQYGVTLSLLMSNTRDLGKGYIFNADCHPDVVSSWWSHERKLAEMVARVQLWEGILDRHRPILLLAELNSQLVSKVCSNRDITDLGLGFMKLGERHFWTENSFYQNRRFFERVHEYTAAFSAIGAEIPDVAYQEFKAATYLDSKIGNGFGRALRDGALRIIRESRHRLKRAVLAIAGRPLPKVPGYRYLGWLPVELRRPFIYRYLQKHGKTPDQLTGYKLVYLPMHLEPEVALMAVSPEFNSTMELVSMLSKSLPADHLIVLKENIVALGMRSRHYYDQFRRIGNVVFADLSVTSWEWIRRSEFTATITGTAAIEAVYFLKPVLSFGRHQVVNLLPTVCYANDLSSTMKAVQAMPEIAGNEHLLRVSRAALHKAQLDSSFDLSGAVSLYEGGDSDINLAKIAVKELRLCYPDTFPQ